MRAPTWLPMPIRRTLRVLRRYWRVAARRLEVYFAPARRSWRRSLQLRVVALTLVASSLLVGAFGWFIAERSAKILLSRAQEEVAVLLNISRRTVINRLQEFKKRALRIIGRAQERSST